MAKIQPIIYDAGLCIHSRATQEKQPFHETYGLWIFRWRKMQKVAGHIEPLPRVFEFYNIAQMLSGRGWYWRQGEKKIDLAPGDAVFNVPGVIHDYNSCSDTFTEDFICFTGPVADALAESGIFRSGVVKFGTVRRLLPIIELVNIPTKLSQLKANIALQKLIIDIYTESEEKKLSSGRLMLDSILREVKSNPYHWWTVSEMAECAHIGVNRFIEVFKSEMSITPKQWLDKLKFSIACEELMERDMTVAKAARKLGYLDPFHFSKSFKRIIGVSPLEYRRRFSIKKQNGDGEEQS